MFTISLGTVLLKDLTLLEFVLGTFTITKYRKQDGGHETGTCRFNPDHRKLSESWKSCRMALFNILSAGQTL